MRSSRKMQSSTAGATANVFSSFISGVGSNAVTHPLNLASHRAVANKVPFLSTANFANPLQGLKSALVAGPALSAEYFVGQHAAKSYLTPYLIDQFNLPIHAAESISGAAAGSVHGIIANTNAAIQRYSWDSGLKGYRVPAMRMWSEGGVKPFLSGSATALANGIIFSGVYQGIRNAVEDVISQNDNPDQSRQPGLLSNLIGAGAAAVVVSPGSYIREVQLTRMPGVVTPPKTVTEVVKELGKEVMSQKGVLNKVGMFSKRVSPGPRAVTAAVGLALGQTLFDSAKSLIENYADKADVEARQVIKLS